jgi:hypothetical protein
MSLKSINTYFLTCKLIQNVQLKAKFRRSRVTALRLVTLPTLHCLKSDLSLLQR